MDQTTHNVRRANWLAIITQCRKRPAAVIRYNRVSIGISNKISDSPLSRIFREVSYA